MQLTTRQSLWGMHLVALAWGSSAVFGAMISAPAQVITLGRCLTAVITLLAIFGAKPIKEFLQLPRKTILLIVTAGFFMALHWIFFFKSIKEGGVAISLVTYATASTQIAIGEVLLLGMSFRLSILVAAILSAVGVFVIHPIESTNQLLDLGLVYGLLSALTVSLMALLIKQVMNLGVGTVTLSFNQLFFAALFSLPFALGSGIELVSLHDCFYILLLGSVCSAAGQTIFNHCIKAVRMSSAAVIASMEVPYGILIAALFIGQEITTEIVLGIILVFASAVIVSRKSVST